MIFAGLLLRLDYEMRRVQGDSMSKPDLSALQRRVYYRYVQSMKPQPRSQSARVSEMTASLCADMDALRNAQLSPIVSKGTSVDPIRPVLAKTYAELLIMASELGIDLSHEMSAHSEAHQQPLLSFCTSKTREMRTIMDDVWRDSGRAFHDLQPLTKLSLHEPLVAMAWRIQTAFHPQSNLEEDVVAYCVARYPEHPSRVWNRKQAAAERAKLG